MRYIYIYNELKNSISSGKYKPHSKLPYVVELMALFKAGRCTVQHALNLLTAEGLVKGVRSRGVYVRERAGAPLFSRNGQIRRVGILCPGSPVSTLRMPYFADICSGIETSLGKQGVWTYLVSCKDKTFHGIIREIHALELDGLCVVDIQDPGLRADLEGTRIPMVYADIYEPRGRVPIVVGDNVRGGYLAAKKLMELGHRRLLFLTHMVRRTNRPEAMGAIKWKGIMEAVRENPMARAKRTVLFLDQRGEEEKVLRLLEENEEGTGFLMPGLGWFGTIRKVLERDFPERLAKTDIVVFECCEGPLRFGRKKAFICKWDGMELGRKVAERLLEKDKGNAGRITYVPMTLS